MIGMDLKQLKALISIVENNLSISDASKRLHLVQSAVSQQISRLEAEVGVKVFVRHGKRLAGLTPAGHEILIYAYRILANTHSIMEVGRDHKNESEGILRIGATHAQARYILPAVIKAFSLEYPDIELQINQGTPQQLVNKALYDEVDFSICTEALGLHPDLLSMPSYRWNRGLIAKKDSPILKHKTLTLETLCDYPLVTYVHGFTGRKVFSETFKSAGLKPRVVLSAADTDVIKTYVRNEMGVGIIANMAFEAMHDDDLILRDLSDLFPWEITKIAYQKDKYLRKHQQRFIDLFQRKVLEHKGLSPP